MKGKGFFQSLKYALAGIKYALAFERNLRIHFVFAGIALMGGLYFRFPAGDMLILSLTISMVLVAEMVNSAMEAAIDLFTTEYSNKARVVKDLAAGAVLLTAVNAVLVALFLFGPPIINCLMEIFKCC